MALSFKFRSIVENAVYVCARNSDNKLISWYFASLLYVTVRLTVDIYFAIVSKY
jgi:hypothetical protein